MRLNSMLRTGLFTLMAAGCGLAQAGQAETDSKVDEAVQAVMREHGIAGMSIAVTRNGTQHFYNYGVASRQTGRRADSDTLYEIGSISKTYTATLATYAQARGRLALSDSPAKYLPELAGSDFAKLSLINLGTHTTGGFPLQVPDAVTNQAQMMAYLKAWKPEHAAGTYRTYANPSIGMLGVVAAKSLNRPFKAAMERDLFPKLGLTSTYIDVPAARMADYAQGYNKQDAPVRVNPGVLADEAYGVKTSARDLIRFVDANMGLNLADAELRGAIAQTHVGYYQLGDMTQDLAWEQLRYPATLDALLTANAGNYNSQSQPVTALNPPLPPQEAVWINKTGSTNGFGGYVAFVPSKKLGIVILANRNYPNEARVRLAYRILGELEK
ncbi:MULTISPECIES: class C beta-lactamase [Achromobacter]|uniref:Beta-lactamase n=2 Tax=Alcaligenes xylosoxydans xylosoxydans TaxID=85698 RepID=A0A424W4H9_ALCXX|nr:MULTISPECIES: class C beta-lactamase [Achromobacter]MBC9904422.1 beta-lactamase [Achromobacter xylosoxidans]MBD0872582.1 beta-lactamase [Achromobacter xylosoxidans]QNP88093.1 beta-lactamase [Achromobacter xylosoxidans]RPJ88155.1 class C beta-lactamase [Achromobacter xylosoxidans]